MLGKTENTGPKHYGGRVVAQAYGTMLHRMHWDHIVTLTFQNEPRYDITALRQFERWVGRIEMFSEKEIGFFGVVEGTVSMHRHVHALLAGTERISIAHMQRYWKGHTHIQRYNGDGFSFYLTKSLTSDDVEYSLKFPRWMDGL